MNQSVDCWQKYATLSGGNNFPFIINKTMKNFLKPIVMTLGVALSMSVATAEEIKKVATIDMKKLFDEYHLTKAAQADVKVKQAAVQKESNEKLTDIRALADKLSTLQKKIEDPTISASNKEKLLAERKDIADQGNALQGTHRDWVQRRQKALNENIVVEMRKILGQIQDRVAEYARENDLDLVLDKSARGSTQTLFLSYSKDKLDITAPLLESLNKDAK